MNTGPSNDLLHELIGAAIEVHGNWPELLELTYDGAYSHKFTLRQIPHVRQKLMPVAYKGGPIDIGYRIDILAEEGLVELKPSENATD